MDSTTDETLKRALDALTELRAGPIAIVGMAARLPGADSPEAFWKRRMAGVDAVTVVPPDRFAVDEIYDPNPDAPGTVICRHGAFLEDPWSFDADHFGISHREALGMDPQQRLLLELAWHALEDAALRPDALNDTRIGVYVGCGLSDYGRRHFWSPDARRIDAWGGTGTFSSVAAGRISYVLGLAGPALAVDTACSSSLVALHLAAQALRLRECDAALVGGANLILAPEPTIAFSRLRALSPTGRCRSFSSEADGYVRGEGGVLFVLKRLHDALRDGDRIHAVLKGTAVNQDGRSNGLTAPSARAQTAVIRAALKNARIEPRDVGFLEAHGTGTPLGDPIEIDGLRDAFGDRPLLIGTVKTHLGHLEPAAGAVGLLEAVLAVRHGVTPPHLHLGQLNPRIDLGPMRIPTESTPFSGHAGVSSFGLSGTNAHVIVGPAPPHPVPAVEGTAVEGTAVDVRAAGGPAVVGLSAPTAELLDTLVSRLAPSTGSDAAHTAHRGRARLRHRSATVWEQGTNRFEARGEGVAGPLAFLFTGQGAQWPNMGRRLYEGLPVVRAVLDRLLDDDLRTAWATDAVHDTTYTQPLVVALQIALAEQWREWDVVPSFVLGHSIGEIAAAAVAGMLTQQEAMALARERGRLMGELPRDGAMAVVFASEDRVRPRLVRPAEIAAINGSTEVTVAGPTAAVDATLSALVDLPHRRLQVSHAFHSVCMEPMLDGLRRVASSLSPKDGNITLISARTGRPERSLDAEHWVRHAREPVRFAAALAHVPKGATFLELGPHPVLTRLAARETTGVFASSLDRDDDLALHKAVATLVAAGHPVARDAVGGPGRVVDLPPTPLRRTRFRLPPVVVEELGGTGDPHPVLGTHFNGPVETWVLRETPAWLPDHVIDGRALVPASELFRMGAALGTLTDVEIQAPCPGGPLHTVLDGDILRICTEREGGFVEHLRARVRNTPEVAPPTQLPAGDPVEISAFEARLAARGHAYGRSFQVVRALSSGMSTSGAGAGSAWARGEIDATHPAAAVDGAMQLLSELIPGSDTLIPMAAHEVLWLRDPVGPIHAIARLLTSEAGIHRADVDVLDGEGVAVAIRDLAVRAVPMRALPGGPLLGRLEWLGWGPGQGAARSLESGDRSPEIQGGDLGALVESLRSADGPVVVRSETSAAWGLVRSARLERPDLSIKLLSGDGPAVDAPEARWVDGVLEVPRRAPRPVPGALSPPPDGVLAHLGLKPAARTAPGPGEVEVRVHVAGVNFRDVLMALGEYPGRVEVLGGEAAGVVLSVGEGVTGLAPGDPVAVVAQGALADVVVCAADRVLRLPDGIPDVVAAASAIAFLTAWLALDGVRPGDRVLVHSAAGGVGIAAVQVARMRGARVVATASGPKQALVRSLGVEEVHDSRTTAFSSATPVDVVLNSLSGPLVDASFSVLKDGGRFVELGKRGVWSQEQAHRVRPDVSFRAFDLTEVPARDQTGGLKQIFDAILGGTLVPLPTAMCPAEEAWRVFTELAAGRHTGKTVLRFSHPAPPRGTLVVTGATGGVGRRLCAHFANRYDVLGIARKAPSDPVPGVRYAEADVSTLGRAPWGDDAPVAVIHAAGETADATLSTLTEQHFSRALSAKVSGAMALARWLPDDVPLVLVGSLAGSRGNAGQGAYAAANAALEDVCRDRLARGGRAVCIHFGPWAHTGLARDLFGLDPAAATECFDHFLRVDGVFELPHREAPPQRPAVEHALDLRTRITTEARLVLGLPAEAPMEAARPLAEMGLDSLMAVELRNRLSEALKQPLPATLLFDHPTLDRLHAYLAAKIPAKPTYRRASGTGRTAETGGPIALVGMACRFPGDASDPDALWKLLLGGVDAVGPVPRDRFDIDRWFGEGPGKSRTREGAFLADIAGFDPQMFGISPREALTMDPQQRLLLEVAWEAFENAGEPAPEHRRCGVFVGICSNDYARRHFLGTDVSRIDAWSGTGAAYSVAAGRLSYAFGLTGPSLAIDTACSSSLVAAHLAIQSLRRGESDLALVGGVSLMTAPEPFVYFSQLDALSRDGRCRTFAADAGGYGRGEGCAVLVLERLEDALRRDDPIVAVLRGSAVNQDGRSAGLTAPTGPAQAEVLRAAWADAGISPEELGYVEAHGTGTPLGDPIELQALREALGDRTTPIWVGSVKTNFGHTEGAAGVAGLAKAALAVERGVIPPHLHFSAPNPHLDWDALGVRVPVEAVAWEGRRIAGVSSFGLSGTNAHVVVEAPPNRPDAPPRPGPYEVALSAHRPESLARLTELVSRRLETHPEDAAALCATANTRRRRLRHRVHARGEDARGLAAALRAAVPDEGEPSLPDAAPGAFARLPNTPWCHEAFWLPLDEPPTGAYAIEHEPVASIAGLVDVPEGDLATVCEDLWRRARDGETLRIRGDGNRPEHRGALAFLRALAGETGRNHEAVDLRGRPRLRSIALPRDTFRTHGTWIVTGGTGALGQRMAKWLADRGAERVVTSSRRGGTVAADVTSALDVARLLTEAGPLTGVVHAAGILDDFLASDLTPTRLRAVLAPKLEGAERLAAALESGVRLVLVSSLAAALSPPGQSAYAAANAAMEALALRRPNTVAVAFGPWTEGMGGTVDWSRSGVSPLSPDRALSLLGAALCSDRTELVLADADWRRVAERLPYDADLLGIRRADRPAGLPLPDLVCAEAASVLGWQGDLPRNRGLFELGMDSLMAVELTRRLQQALGRALPSTLVFDHASVDGIAAFLQQDRAADEIPVGWAPQTKEPIAIAGLACRFPGASDPDAFWSLLCAGLDRVGPIPPDRFDVEAFFASAPGTAGKSYARHGAFLDEIDTFDPERFGITPKEAERLDPQQRMLLEVSWDALEDAGIAPDSLREKRAGVFVGIGRSDWFDRLKPTEQTEVSDPYGGSGTDSSFAAGRVAYVLGLRGPALSVNTACSSSLVATHLAVQSLRAGECDVALAGGAHLMLSPEAFVYLSQIQALSPTGRCRTFSADADGYVRGEGVGMSVLLRLSDAIARGLPIRAVIHGSAVNHDGPSAGLTVPNGRAQEEVIRTALLDAGVPGAEIGYLEAHGTGTRLGDPIEVRAAVAAMAPRTEPLVIGSVKTNVGHLEAAAGIAGLVKAAFVAATGEIPPHLNLTSPNPDLDATAIEVPTSRKRLSRPFVGLSSFGLSGTNCHLVLGAPPRTDLGASSAGSHASAAGPHAPSAGPWILPLSAHHADALDRLAESWQSASDVASAVRTAWRGRAALPWRRAAVVERDLTPLVQAPSRRASVRSVRLGFLFTGQGSQWPGMGEALLAHAASREVLERVDAALGRRESLLEVWRGDALHDTAWTQPGLYALQLALVAWWDAHGVKPDALIGHSIGEVSAAVVAGVLSLEDGARLVEARGRLMSALPRDGAMAAVFAPSSAVEPLLTRGLSIAATNAPDEVVVSGDARELEALLASVDAEHKPLRVSHAFHSPRMEAMLDEFRAVATTLAYAPPRVPLVSNRSGTWADETLTTPDYWVRHVRDTVRFAEGIAVLADRVDHFVEIGPHPVLLGMAQACLPPRDGRIGVASLRRNAPATTLLQGLADLWTTGVPVVPDVPDAPLCRLPHTPRSPRRFWIETGRRVPPPAELVFEETWHALPATALPATEPRTLDPAWRIVTPGSLDEAVAVVRAEVDAGRKLAFATDDPLTLAFARSVALEHPELEARRLVGVAPDRFAEALTIAEPEVRWAGRWEGRRLVRVPDRVRGKPPVRLRPGGTYLVTGGLGGLGTALARWLAQSGAGRIVLTSRRTPSRDPEIPGTSVVVVAADVSRSEDVDRILGLCGDDLAGVFHLAGVIEDGPVTDLTAERLQRILAGKLLGGRLLHERTRDRGLDFFVLLGSLASVLGSPGQAAYAAANAGLDALARERRAAGAHALCLSAGPVAEVGMAARQGDTARRRAESQGLALLPVDALWRALGALLQTDLASAAVFEVRHEERLRAALGASAVLMKSLESGVRSPEVGSFPPDSRLQAPASGLEPPNSLEPPVERILRIARAVMGHLPHHPLDARRPLVEQGLDSLMAVELRNRVHAETGVSLPMQLVISGAPAEVLAEHVSPVRIPADATPDAPSQATPEEQPPPHGVQVALAAFAGLLVGALLTWWLA